MKYINFETAYGRLGTHPGTLNAAQGRGLFNYAMRYAPGTHFLDYWPDGGRSTVILAAAAKNIDAKITVITQGVQTIDVGWLFRAVKTHGLTVAIDPQQLPARFDLIVLRENALEAVPFENGRFFVIGDAQLPGGYCMERGAGWAVYSR